MSFSISSPQAAALPVLVAGAIAGVAIHFEKAATVTVTTPAGAATTKGAVEELGSSAGISTETAQWIDEVFDAQQHIAPATATLLANKTANIRAMLNIGVRHNAIQISAYEVASNDAALQAVVSKIVVAAAGGYLAGAQPGFADAIVAAALYEPLALLLPPSVVIATMPEYAAWFTGTTSTPAFQSALAVTRTGTGGSTRIGGQVDLRPQHARVSIAADAAIERNAGYKKASSQRDSEKAAKEDVTSAPASGAHASAGAGAGAGASSGPASSSLLATAAQPESNKTLPTLSSAERIAVCEGQLRKLGVAFSTYAHAVAPDVPTLLSALEGIPGGRCKNLVIKAKKEKAAGDSMIWLVVALTDTKVDLTDLAKRLGYGKIMLRFAQPEVMVENLGVGPGNATPLALLNDTALVVNVALDKALLSQPSLLFHPLTNDASTAISADDLLKLCAATGHTPEIVDFTAA